MRFCMRSFFFARLNRFLYAGFYCIWRQFFRINYREKSHFYIALSSFLPFSVVEMPCSFVLNYTFFFRRVNKGVESLRTNIMKALLTVVTFAVTFHSIYSGRRLWNKSFTRKLMKLYAFKLQAVITFRSNLLYEVFKTEVNVQSSPDVRWNL